MSKEQILKILKYNSLFTVENAIEEMKNFFNVKKKLGCKLKDKSEKDIYNVIKEVVADTYRDEEKIIWHYNLYVNFDMLDNREFLVIINDLIKNNHNSSEYTSMPKELLDIMFNMKSSSNNILLVDIEKYGIYAYDYIKNNLQKRFFISLMNENNIDLYKNILIFDNVEFIEEKIFNEKFTTKRFDYIICFPPFGCKLKEKSNDMISSDISLSYAQNLLYYIKEQGILRIIMPAKVGFAGGDIESFREYVNNNYKINKISLLTSNVFKPYSRINTYYIEFTNGKTENVEISKIDRNKTDSLVIVNDKLLLQEEFEEMIDWNVENLLTDKSTEMIKYENSSVRKESIKNIADVLKGKTITNKSENGNIKVINISNINGGEIDYSNLDSIEDNVIKNARYILKENDLLISARGTVIKVAIFKKQNYECVASSNLNVIRCKENSVRSEYLKLFLESKVGIELVNSITRGSISLNINYKDIEMINVPVPSMTTQCELIKKYNDGKRMYDEEIKIAEEKWKHVKGEVVENLYQV